jgi:para-nitrobenzyl esterase
VRLRLLVPLWCVLLLAAACSGDDDAGEAADASADASEAPSDPLQISTELGTVQGADSAVEGVRAFLRIPYAAPPTGADRWRPPQPREPYDGVLDATQAGGSCPQDVGGSTARFTTIPDPEEDCLTLSVWAPTDAEDRPVMFWIHGGGFRAGSAHQPYYAGDNLAARGVVVVNVNYRLGPLGFLATDELAEESEDGSYGNYGIAD